MIIFVLGNALVITSAFLLAKIFFSNKNSADLILSCFVFYLAQIIIVGLSLGMLGRLYLGYIMSLHLGITWAVFLAYRRLKPGPLAKPDISFILGNKILLFAAAIFLGFFFLKAWNNLIAPPICPDSLQYHLSFPAFWLRNGNLNNPFVVFGSWPTSAEMTALSYYPINAELFFFWLMLPLRNAFLADLGEAPFYFVGILAAYSILTKYAVKKDTALLIGFLWALIPNLFKQVRFGSQVDVICAVLFLLVFNSLLLLKKELKLKNAALLGITLGIFFGVKVTDIFWSLALLPLFLFFMYKHLKEGKAGQVIACSFLIILGLFLFGSFSYLRTFVFTGNPFYPVRLEMFGRTLLPGFIDRDAFSRLFVRWEEFKIRNMFFGEGLGVQFLAFIFPGSLAPLAVFPFIRKKAESLWENTLLFFAPALMLWMYIFYFKAYWIRYLFPYLGMGLITAVIFLERFRWGRKYITVLGFICILGSAAELAHRNELALSLILSLLFFFALLKSRNFILKYSRPILSIKALVIFTFAISLVLFVLNGQYVKNKFFRYSLLFKGKESADKDIVFAWKWMDENTGSGRRIAYTGRSEFYPLFGTGIKNDVFYTSINDKPPLAHYYPDGLYRKDKDFPAWKHNLKSQGVEYLFVALPHELNNESEDLNRFPIEDEWARLHPGDFVLVFSNSKAHIYKILF